MSSPYLKFIKIFLRITMNVSERIVLLRKQHLISQKKLSEELSISEIAVQNYESGRRKPAFDVLISIADYFNVSIDYLVGRTDNPEVNK